MALSAVRVDADESLRSLNPYSIPYPERNCLFEDETKLLRFHKRYSQANCFLECSLIHAQKELKRAKNVNHSCTPWYFPMDDGKDSLLCDPWEAMNISQWMQVQIIGELCGNCSEGLAILKAFFVLIF